MHRCRMCAIVPQRGCAVKSPASSYLLCPPVVVTVAPQRDHQDAFQWYLTVDSVICLGGVRADWPWLLIKLSQMPQRSLTSGTGNWPHVPHVPHVPPCHTLMQMQKQAENFRPTVSMLSGESGFAAEAASASPQQHVCWWSTGERLNDRIGLETWKRFGGRPMKWKKQN